MSILYCPWNSILEANNLSDFKGSKEERNFASGHLPWISSVSDLDDVQMTL